MNRTKFALSIIVFVLTFSMMLNYQENKPKVATYTIIEQVNYGDKFFDWLYNVEEDKRKHAIIQIMNTGENSRHGACSAFVISDTAALTAGHCLQITKNGLKRIIEKNLPKSEKLEEMYLERIIFLETKCVPEDAACYRELEYTKSMLEKELAIRKEVLSKKPDEFKVMDINGDDAGITVTAYSKGTRRDYGWVEGDFKNFKKMPLRPGWHVKPGDTLRTCGFFGGRLPPSCVNFVTLGNFNFDYAGKGIIVPGVSGGPVIDHLGYAVGIASRVTNDSVIMVPTIGLINILTKKQAEKHKKETATE